MSLEEKRLCLHTLYGINITAGDMPASSADSVKFEYKVGGGVI